MEMKFTCMGSGQFNYDVINLREYEGEFVLGKKNSYVEKNVVSEAGGTAGNVMCMLSYLGWTAQPQVKLIDADEGKALAASLESFGCDTRYVQFDPKGGFAGLRCTHRRNKQTGEWELGRRGYGANGSRFAKRTELRAKDEVLPFLDSVEKAPDVYFFDTLAAGPRGIAESLKERGSLIYYEAEPVKEDGIGVFRKCCEIADIVKTSNENVKELSDIPGFSEKLVIYTLGSEGMKFCLRGGEWIKIPVVPVDGVKDAEGCGDTTTAVFISELGKLGLPKVSDLTEEQVRKALEAAAEKAAVCTQYYGSKGWVHAGK